MSACSIHEGCADVERQPSEFRRLLVPGTTSGQTEMTMMDRRIAFALLCCSLCGCSSIQQKSSRDWAGYTEKGMASYYAKSHESNKTASGERYDGGKKTAAHKILPFGTRVEVTNVENGKSVVVKINDRGPRRKDRILDLSQSAFAKISGTELGVIKVRMEVID